MLRRMASLDAVALHAMISAFRPPDSWSAAADSSRAATASSALSGLSFRTLRANETRRRSMLRRSFPLIGGMLQDGLSGEQASRESGKQFVESNDVDVFWLQFLDLFFEHI